MRHRPAVRGARLAAVAGAALALLGAAAAAPTPTAPSDATGAVGPLDLAACSAEAFAALTEPDGWGRPPAFVMDRAFARCVARRAG